jgi:hypothetical protein
MTYYSTRPAEALTNALERLMISISNSELEQNHVALCEYRRACDLLGYDPKMAQWNRVEGIHASGLPNDDPHTVDYYPEILPKNTTHDYYPLLNPEE